ncbi:MAG: 1-acyl-sn-glycerol-3-phosphate acyltransferase, partial [Deltaproteobacteria bacterium]|nr:1-acyl-sn-glycerol-3-phosphate acyltransferase [Deltaproteobacteria bacterium]
SILSFPEGHRTVTGHVGTFHDGLFHVAVELGVPVVPVAVTGLYEVLHKGSLIIRPGNEIIVYVEEPIPTDGMTTEDVPALRDRVRNIISARVEARRS